MTETSDKAVDLICMLAAITADQMRCIQHLTTITEAQQEQIGLLRVGMHSLMRSVEMVAGVNER